ncbi:MAG TPA: molybdopterin cofactor-binding domain-containing protein, partial [Trebonia sp.]|nr:molybdopterin cofactor-binding domain-containing protein [Trebonia sp.]
MTELPATLAANPRLSAWLRVRPEGTVDIHAGRVELGQGVLTALAQVAAEELDVDLGRVTVLPATTGRSPDEGYTAGSMSIQYGAASLRVACAEARGRLVAAAAVSLGVPADELTVTDGEITAPGYPDGRSTSYWSLAEADAARPGDGLLDVDATGAYPVKDPGAYRIVGTSVPRIDLPEKVTGQPRYVHDLAPEGLLYGQVVRPPSRGARLKGFEENQVRGLPGVVTIVRDGDFLALIAERPEVALRARSLLSESATWDETPALPDPADLPGYLRSAAAETTVLADVAAPSPAPGSARSEGTRSFEAVYHKPYLAHASIGPSSATARFTPASGAAGPAGPGRLQVWSHVQGPYPLRAELARALGLPVEHITVTHAEGAGCYGHNGADDAALDAALLALSVPGQPVQVTWSRADELGWAPFGTAGVVRIAADADEDGKITSWQHEIWGNGYVARPGSLPSVSLLAASHRAGGSPIAPAAEPPLANGGGAGRNAVPGYDFP